MPIGIGNNRVTFNDGTILGTGNIPQLIEIAAVVSANAITVSAALLRLDFRNTALTNGAVTKLSGTPTNLVIAATDSFGAVTADGIRRIAILAINNGGVIKLAAASLAGGVNLDETGVITTAATATAVATVKADAIYTGAAYRIIGFIDVPFTTSVGWGALATVQGIGGQAMAAMSSLGYGQTWQSVLGSRAFGTTYYNTTGKPICVTILGTGAQTSTTTLYVNGLTISTNNLSIVGGTFSAWASCIVPSGANYSATGSSLVSWLELR